MKKSVVLGATLLVTSAFAYPNPSLQKMGEIKSGDICPIHALSQVQVTIAHDHRAMADGSVAYVQDRDSSPEQQPSPPNTGHRISPGDGCSSVNPDAKPGTELNGVKPNTVGCTCARKCVGGQIQEDLSKDEKGVYICRNASHKDRCFCPDPCKS